MNEGNFKFLLTHMRKRLDFHIGRERISVDMTSSHPVKSRLRKLRHNKMPDNKSPSYMQGEIIVARMILSTVLITFLTMLAVPATAQSRYDNSVDKKTYETPGQFKTYQPIVSRDTHGQRVATQQVILLTGEPDISARVKVEDLRVFIQSVEARAYVELAKSKTAMSAMVQFNCKPEKCEVKMATQGQAEEATLQALYDTLSQLPALTTTGEVIFQVIFEVGA